MIRPEIETRRSRISFIERAKGLGIILVVSGHLAGRVVPPGNEWYRHYYWQLYLFHMPFFMFLSGLVFGLTNGPKRAVEAYGAFIAGRAKRLLVPFLLLGLFAVLAKTFGQYIIHVQQAPESFSVAISRIFINTQNGPVIFIWYAFVLFWFLAITPILFRYLKPWSVFAIALAVYFIPPPDAFFLDKAFSVFVFFVAGAIAGLNYERFEEALPTTAIPFLVFIGLLLMFEFTPDTQYDMLLAGAMSIPALLYLVRTGPAKGLNFLEFLGRYTFVIYLFNTIFMGLARSLLQAVLPYQGPYFLLYIAILMAVGIFGPVLAKIYIFRRVKFLDQITS